MGDIYDLTEWDLEDSHEPTAVEGGKEYEIRVLSVSKGTDKNDNDYFNVRFEIVNEPYSKDFNKLVYPPDKDKMDAKQLNLSKHNMKVFLQAFGLADRPRLNFQDELPGCTGWALLGKKNDEEYGEQNFVRKFIAPRS